MFVVSCRGALVSFFRLFLSLVIVAPAAADILKTTPDARSLLNAVDMLLSPNLDIYTSELSIAERQGEKSKPVVHYHMLTAKAYGSILTSKDGDQNGQKILSTERGFWFFAPRTHRAIRLTPNQLLRGQASVGDIANISYSDDYAIIDLVPAMPDLTAKDPRQTWVIQLAAKSKKSSYASVSLTVTADGVPLHGELFARSGRVLKRVVYSEPQVVAGQTLIVESTYIDGLDEANHTRVSYGAIEPSSARRMQFTVEALVLQ